MTYLVCDNCGLYYELQSGESPEDFADKCECGGNLKYVRNLDYSDKLKNVCPICGDVLQVNKGLLGVFQIKDGFCRNCGYLQDENKYLFEWIKIFVPMFILVLLFGIITQETWIALIGLAALLIILYTFFENKFFSKIEEMFNIQLKIDNGFSLSSYTYKGLFLLILILGFSIFLVYFLWYILIN